MFISLNKLLSFCRIRAFVGTLFSRIHENKNTKHAAKLHAVENLRFSTTSSTNAYSNWSVLHLVDASPWPIFTSLNVLALTLSLVSYMHRYNGGWRLLLLSLLFVMYSMYVWFRDISRESLGGHHTKPVVSGLQLGMMLFILTECMFFVGLLWAYLNAGLMPTVSIGLSWPPEGIISVDWQRKPLVNTALLFTSFLTANVAKYAMDIGNKEICKNSLIQTILLGVLFTFYQWKEYGHTAFTMSDSVYGSNFFLTTGFHGFHVIVGVVFLIVALLQIKTTTPESQQTLTLSILYWHFVDVVWIALMLIVYIWGSPEAPFRIPNEALLPFYIPFPEYLSYIDIALDTFSALGKPK